MLRVGVSLTEFCQFVMLPDKSRGETQSPSNTSLALLSRHWLMNGAST